jgi:transposase InsO family protein
MCKVLAVSRSGYYAWRSRGQSARARRDADLTRRIKEIHEESRGTYGAPRIHAELALGQGIRCSRKRVARLMRLAGVVGVHRRRSRRRAKPDKSRPRQPDLVDRDFSSPGPNRLWVADLTQHMTNEGWVYLATVLDVFSRKVVGWAMGDRATTGLEHGRGEPGTATGGHPPFRPWKPVHLANLHHQNERSRGTGVDGNCG